MLCHGIKVDLRSGWQILCCQEQFLVTDKTTYLDGRYDEEDLVTFDLSEYEKLPSKIKALLKDREYMGKIARNGKNKTEKTATWEIRAKQLMLLLKEIRK